VVDIHLGGKEELMSFIRDMVGKRVVVEGNEIELGLYGDGPFPAVCLIRKAELRGLRDDTASELVRICSVEFIIFRIILVEVERPFIC